MADYIYLLETRLTPAQQKAIAAIRTAAREQDYTVFLTGGAVRDMTGGGSIRDLDLTVQGDALTLKSALEAAGATVHGEHAEARRLFLHFAGGVRAEVSSAMSVSFPKPGKPEYVPAGMTDDLRSRDFTANAMAISLNDGSYGLLMDPLNGVADIENRELRLVSNYGFIEDPSRLIRAARLRARLGWHLEERAQQRYDAAKEEGYISALSAWNRGYELEEIFHEEDPVRVLRALEGEGWLSALTTTLSSAKAASTSLADVAERQGQLQTQGIFAQSAALTFPLLTAKLSGEEVTALKAQFVRPGFVQEIDSLELRTRDFAAKFAAKDVLKPSATWRMLHEAEPNLVLSLLYSGKAGGTQSRLKTFLTDSPTARQRVPYVLMGEMRITPDLPGYDELVEKLFFELMDGNLSTPEEMKAYLEPYSPPAPPPPVSLRRARAKKEARPSRAKAKKSSELPPTVAAEEEAAAVAAGLMEPGTLTGPNHGPEPTPQVPLAGKVSPLPETATEQEAPNVARETLAVSRTVSSAKPASATKQTKAPAPIKASAEEVRTPVIVAKPRNEVVVAAHTKNTSKEGAPAKEVKSSPKPAVAVPPSASGKKNAPAASLADVGKSATKSAPLGKAAPQKGKPTQQVVVANAPATKPKTGTGVAAPVVKPVKTAEIAKKTASVGGSKSTPAVKSASSKKSVPVKAAASKTVNVAAKKPAAAKTATKAAPTKGTRR